MLKGLTKIVASPAASYVFLELASVARPKQVLTQQHRRQNTLPKGWCAGVCATVTSFGSLKIGGAATDRHIGQCNRRSLEGLVYIRGPLHRHT